MYLNFTINIKTSHLKVKKHDKQSFEADCLE